MAYLIQFGSYVFPAGFAPMTQTSAHDVAEQERPRADGAITQAARTQSRRLTVQGSAMGFGGGVTAIQAAVDAIRGACGGSGQVAPLFFGRDDRFINAQCTGITESYEEGQGSLLGVSHKLAITFTAGDPYFYATTATNAAGLTAAGGNITPGGNASAFATWSITVTGGGTGAIMLTNTTTGETATLGTAATAWGNGDTITLTRSPTVYTVAKNGGAAPGLLMGLIPTLQVGVNALTLAASAGLTLGALGCTYTARWQS